ncbi:MAG: hypothetical protein WC476_01505 [Phycisphaerae bacterium]|jgi:hypothetical protein
MKVILCEIDGYLPFVVELKPYMDFKTTVWSIIENTYGWDSEYANQIDVSEDAAVDDGGWCSFHLIEVMQIEEWAG